MGGQSVTALRAPLVTIEETSGKGARITPIPDRAICMAVSKLSPSNSGSTEANAGSFALNHVRQLFGAVLNSMSGIFARYLVSRMGPNFSRSFGSAQGAVRDRSSR